MVLRRLAIVGLSTVGCFGSAPMLETDTAVATDSSSTGAPMCAAGEVVLPVVPEGWDGPAWVAIGTPGVPQTSCPEATIASSMFLGEPAMAACACTCDLATVCGTTHSVGDGCDAVSSLGALNGCSDLTVSAAAIDLSVSPEAPTCVATPQPFAADASPVRVCTIAGAGDGCEPEVPGFVGPCIIGGADACPEGLDELAADAAAVFCDACVECDAQQYCDGVRYQLFDEAGCSGMPVASVTPAENCMGMLPPFSSVRAVELPRLDTGCASTTASTQSRRICCVPP